MGTSNEVLMRMYNAQEAQDKLKGQFDGLCSNLNALENKCAGVPDRVGMLTIKSANRTLLDASQRPNPKALWLSLWYEGVACCLFADSNLGKSIYAVQIATDIAKSQRVLYADFELSDKQFQLRYTNDDTGELYKFPDNLYRMEIDADNYDAESFEDNIINNLQDAVIQTESKVLIIDNLTYLCSATEKGDIAGTLMMRLIGLKRKLDLSILVLAHTPKRPLTNPITQNDLAGSKKLYNYFDSAFAIGKSVKDSNLRYVKQLKVRYGNYTYDSDNVIVCAIEKVNGFLQFTIQGYSQEEEHLRDLTNNDRDFVKGQAKELSASGKSVRDIAEQLGISKSTAGRYINN